MRRIVCKNVNNMRDLGGYCNKEGKQSKPQQDYRLFRFKEGKVRLLDMVIDGKQDWAPELWAAVEDEF